MPRMSDGGQPARSWLDTILDPLVPKSVTRPLQEKLSPGTEPSDDATIFDPSMFTDVGRNLLQHPGETLRGFGAGAIEGLRSMTSPVDVASVTPVGRIAKLGGGAAVRALESAAPRASQLIGKVDEFEDIFDDAGRFLARQRKPHPQPPVMEGMTPTRPSTGIDYVTNNWRPSVGDRISPTQAMEMKEKLERAREAAAAAEGRPKGRL